MYATSDVLDELIMYLAQQTNPEAILAFQATDTQQARFEDLMHRSKTTGLSADETRELEQFLHFNRLVTRLKTQAAARRSQ
jgi:hypothetical protein